LKTFLFATYYRIQRIRGIRGDALYKLMIDIDIDIDCGRGETSSQVKSSSL